MNKKDFEILLKGIQNSPEVSTECPLIRPGEKWVPLSYDSFSFFQRIKLKKALKERKNQLLIETIKESLE